jgi:hypothetical protein
MRRVLSISPKTYLQARLQFVGMCPFEKGPQFLRDGVLPLERMIVRHAATMYSFDIRHARIDLIYLP